MLIPVSPLSNTLLQHEPESFVSAYSVAAAQGDRHTQIPLGLCSKAANMGVGRWDIWAW